MLKRAPGPLRRATAARARAEPRRQAAAPTPGAPPRGAQTRAGRRAGTALSREKRRTCTGRAMRQ
eukprot:2707304-Pyramimonas_sp.AAC.1